MARRTDGLMGERVTPSRDIQIIHIYMADTYHRDGLPLSSSFGDGYLSFEESLPMRVWRENTYTQYSMHSLYFLILDAYQNESCVELHGWRWNRNPPPPPKKKINKKHKQCQQLLEQQTKPMAVSKQKQKKNQPVRSQNETLHPFHTWRSQYYYGSQWQYYQLAVLLLASQ